MVDKIKNASNYVEEIKDKFKTVLTDIKSLDKKELKALGQEYYEDIKAAFHAEEIKSSVKHGISDLESTIQKSPLRTVAVCVGIGFVLAKVCGLWKSG